MLALIAIIPANSKTFGSSLSVGLLAYIRLFRSPKRVTNGITNTCILPYLPVYLHFNILKIFLSLYFTPLYGSKTS